MEGILIRTEARIKKALEKIKDNAVHKEVDTVFNLARSESKKAIQTPNLPQSKKEKLPHVAVTTLHPDKICSTFRLRAGGGKSALECTKDEMRKVPEHLKNILADYGVATSGSPPNEALMRCRIDAILLTCLAAQKRASSRDSGSSILSVHLQCETDMLLPWRYEGEQKVVSGITDYSLWYKAPEEMESNLLVIEAKKKGTAGDYQALAYMAMLHHARKAVNKKDCTIYGIATDSFAWTFLYLDNDGRYSRIAYFWDNGDQDVIVSTIHKIIRRAASLSKEELQRSATATGKGQGVKRTLSGHSKLEGFSFRGKN
ncbi:predicted protein [Aspergillus terreus NIH2624]|uniref:Fungal-type protein kinase domain-containing protein n=1 Tax=Aspergillus terreus (strain NIH 2624 / FGSC A1156) TaxID=341663 RepID=Q0CV58_ASPTN|nr:uncharacterized protein ATEG_02426 [Aspergillus terreus NIH2624]EAU37388.1 predicted protein [Aspergillus terreus NIH2624]